VKQALAVCGAAGARGSTEMLDVVMLALAVGFFALSVGYAVACDHL
jgi:preprotein translocase subunit SecG